jgi:hypothetical protein
MLRRVLFATALLLVCLAQRPADAFWGYAGYGTNYYGYGLPAGWYTGVNGRMPPYFALHPPVYYSGEIVRIPYGMSPFAYPWGTPFGVPAVAAAPALAMASAMPVSNQVAEAVVIENEFYQPNQGTLPAPKPNAKPGVEKQGQSRGVMILNPYYRAETQVASR